MSFNRLSQTVHSVRRISNRSIRTMLIANECKATSPTSAPFVRSFHYNRAVLEADSHDDFKPKASPIPESLEECIKLVGEQVNSNTVMLYMKGTPAAPQCGFSQQTVRLLNAVGADFSSVNVLQYPAIREAVKVYGEWPTIPQLYVKGEFVGGCDIVTSMYKDGELETLLKKHGAITEE